jgi:hypothetical protein
MLRVSFIPVQHRNEPIFLEPNECENMITFNIQNEFGIYTTITVNGLLKTRTLKKILKFHFSKEGEWPTMEYFDDNFFNDYTQLNHFQQYSDTIRIKFYPDEPENVYIKYQNGDFKTQISIRDNFQKLKKRLISNFYIGKDIMIGNAFGNEYNSYITVMPIKDNLYLHIPIRDNFQKLKKRLISNFYIGKDIKIGDAFGNEYNLYIPLMPIKDNLYLHIPVRDNQSNTTKWEMDEQDTQITK